VKAGQLGQLRNLIDASRSCVEPVKLLESQEVGVRLCDCAGRALQIHSPVEPAPLMDIERRYYKGPHKSGSYPVRCATIKS
jgi:hypothetical protein